jgi:hypothetical protein
LEVSVLKIAFPTFSGVPFWQHLGLMAGGAAAVFVSWAGTSIRWELAGISQEISEDGMNCEFQNGKG